MKKRKFERDIVETEVFLEAVPNTYILTYIITRISETGDIIAQNGFRGAPGSYNIILFGLSFLTSVISASLSMAKSLKVIICCYQSFNQIVQGGRMPGGC